MTDSGKEEQQEITQEKTQDSDDPEPSAEESQEISHESEEKENPEKDEADGCKEYIESQINLVKPKVIVLLRECCIKKYFRRRVWNNCKQRKMF